MMESRRNGDRRTFYTIRVQGRFDHVDSVWLPGLEVIPERDDVTCLQVTVPDQDMLHRILQAVLHQGLPLLLVQQEEPCHAAAD